MKKLLAVILAAVLSLPGINVFAEEAAAEGDYRTDAVFALGLMDTDAAGDKKLDKTATRLDFAIALYRALNYDDNAQQGMADEQIYSDVDLLHYGAAYLEYLTNMGITAGYTDGSFGIDSEITLDEAYTMLVKCAGCFRGTKTDIGTIRDVANRIGLTDKIRGVGTSGLTRLDMAKLLYNLLFCDYSGFSGFEGNYFIYNADSSFLEEVMNLSYEDGVVTMYDGVSLYDEKAEPDRLIVNGKDYKCDVASDTDWLGMRARVVYGKDMDDVRAVFAPKSNNIRVIDAPAVQRYDNDTYTYEVDGRQKKAKVSKDADVLYNDYVCYETSKMIPYNGKVVLIDNDNDLTYEVVRVYEYESYVLLGVSTVFEGAEMTFKNTDANGKKISVNAKDYERVRVDSVWNDYEKRIGAIKPDTVVTLCRAGNKVLSVYTCKDSVEVTDIKTELNDYDRKVIKDADGTEYGMATNTYVTGWDLSGIKPSAVLYFDINGYVAAVVCGESDGNWKYGYILTLHYDDEEEQVIMKILTQNNVVEKKEISGKVRLDGETVKVMRELYDGLQTAYEQFINSTPEGKERVTTRLLRYYEQDGVIKRLDTPVVQSLYDTTEYPGYGDDNKLMLRAKGNLYSKRVQGNMTMKTIYPTDSEVLGEVNLKDSAMTVFTVPVSLTGDESYTDDYNAATLAKANITHEKFYPASGYNIDTEDMECEVLILRNEVGLSDKEMITVVDKVVDMLDKDNEICRGIGSYFSGKKSEVLEVMHTSKVAGSKIKKGDVIKYQRSGDKIFISELLYRPGSTAGTLNVKPNPDDGNMNSTVIACGPVERVSDSWMQIKAPRNLTALIPLQNRVLIYDAETKELSVGTAKDLRTVHTHGNGADLFIYYVDKYSIEGACAIRGVTQ